MPWGCLRSICSDSKKMQQHPYSCFCLSLPHTEMFLISSSLLWSSLDCWAKGLDFLTATCRADIYFSHSFIYLLNIYRVPTLYKGT